MSDPDICERCKQLEQYGCSCTAYELQSFLEEKVTEQAAEIDRLREALKPFSEVAGVLFSKNWNAFELVVDQGPNMTDCLTFQNFLDARAALGEQS